MRMGVTAALWCSAPTALEPGGAVCRLPQGNHMRSFMKPNLLMSLQQNAAGLIVDIGILAVLLVLLAVR